MAMVLEVILIGLTKVVERKFAPWQIAKGKNCSTLRQLILHQGARLDFNLLDTIEFWFVRASVRSCLAGLKGGVEMELPKCQKCNNGILIPLSDYGQEGASVTFKAWACTNPECGFSLRVDKGEISYGKKIEPKH